MGILRPIEVDSPLLENAAHQPPNVRDIVLRLAWAGSLCRTVVRWESEWVFGEALNDVLTADPHHDPPCYIIRDRPLPQPPPQIALLAADCVHSLRAALEYLVRQLVIASGKVPVDGRGKVTTFPIRDQPRSDGEPPQVSPGIDLEMRRALETVQPYRHITHADVAQHPLRLLRELSNADKHRLLNTTVINAGYTISGLKLEDGLLIPLDITQGWGRRTRAREVMRVAVPRVDQVAAVEVSDRFGYVGWSKPPGGAVDLSVGSTLAGIYRYVLDAVWPAFRPFLR